MQVNVKKSSQLPPSFAVATKTTQHRYTEINLEFITNIQKLNLDLKNKVKHKTCT